MADAPDLHTLVDAFLQHTKVERGLAPNTVSAYARDLARFAQHVSAAGVERASGVRREHVSSFMGSLEHAGLGARSRARALVAVRRLLRFAVVEGVITESDPLQGLMSPHLPRTLPRVLSEEQTEALIEAADTTTSLGLRDRAMLEVGYGAGLRVTELVSLPLGAVDRRGGALRVVGKGGRERVVPLGLAALEALDVYRRKAGRCSWLGAPTRATPSS